MGVSGSKKSKVDVVTTDVKTIHEVNDVVTEAKGSYESTCWSGRDGMVRINQNPTSSDDFRKWQILMKHVRTESTISLYLDSGDFDIASFNNIYIPAFCDMLKNNHVITALEFGQILNNSGLKCVCKILHSHKTITSVSLWDNQCKGSGAELEHLLLNNKCIKSLRVTVGTEDLKYIAMSIPYNSTLTSLDLNNVWSTKIDDKGMRMLCQGLLKNHSITKITLSCNRIGDAGARELCSVLEVNHTITDISLSSNVIVVLPEAFAFLIHIKKLLLANNSHLQFPPYHIANDDDPAKLLEFFADFRAGSVKLKRLQVVFLGNGGAGKTTLKAELKKVLQQTHSSEENSSKEEIKCSSPVLQRAIERVGKSIDIM